MTWFRVEDATEKHTVLVVANDVKHACKVYMEDYPPDLYVKEATFEEIAAWTKKPGPWPTD